MTSTAGPPPVDTPQVQQCSRRRRQRALLVLLLATAIAAATWVAVIDDSSSPVITHNQLAQVTLGDTKHDTSRALGGPRDRSSLARGPANESADETDDSTVQRYDDCWSYRLANARQDDASVATVCLNTGEEVVRIDTT